MVPVKDHQQGVGILGASEGAHSALEAVLQAFARVVSSLLLAASLSGTACRQSTPSAGSAASSARVQDGPVPAVATLPVTRTLYTEPAQGFRFAYTLVNQAKTSIDMTMYELVDTTFSADLVAACKRGVKVRVILDQNLEKSSNAPAYTQINAQPNCVAAYANPAFQATHEKSLVIDGATLVLMTANLTSRYYATTRDFALVENDPADLAAVEATFNADFNSTTSFGYNPGVGDHLIWSPTTAQADLLGVINGATKTLLVENEEMSAANIVSALETACKRGVGVQVTMTNLSSYAANLTALEAAKCGIHVYPDTTSALYIHAKVMVADFGLATQKVYLGSINFSIPSMTENRELGTYVTDAGIAKQLQTTLASDYAAAPAFSASASQGGRRLRP
jgi:cardiolipin synthase